jgi:hypothetical protein
LFLCSLGPRRPAANAYAGVLDVSQMMNGCGPVMMLLGGLGMLLGLTLLARLMVLAWVVIERLRREPTVSLSGRS